MPKENDLSVLIGVKLDTSQQAITNINEQVKLLAKKLDSINLKIDIDPAQFKILSSNIQKLNTDITKALNINQNSFNLDKVTDKFVKGTNEAVQRTKEYTNQIGQSIKEIQILDNETKKLQTTTSYVTDNYKKQRDEIDKLANSMANLREKSQQRVSNEDKKSELLQNKAINKALEDNYKQQLKNQELIISNQNKFNSEIKQAEINMTNLQRRMGDTWNPTPFNTWLTKFKQLDPASEKFIANLKALQMEYKNLSSTALLSMSQQNKLLAQNDNALSIFMKDTGKLALWGAAATAVYAPLRKLQAGIMYIAELDNALNEIRIVTNKTQLEVNNLALSYNNLAKEMSVTTKEIASTSASLFRQGLNDSQVEERMKSIIEYAKISSISLEESNKIITATANATGESVQKIIDVFALLGDTTASGKHMCPIV